MLKSFGLLKGYRITAAGFHGYRTVVFLSVLLSFSLLVHYDIAPSIPRQTLSIATAVISVLINWFNEDSRVHKWKLPAWNVGALEIYGKYMVKKIPKFKASPVNLYS